MQHYGYKYDYKARAIDRSMRIGDLPTWAVEIADAFCERGLWDERPDQVIVNEYEPGQGIAPHVDCLPCFTGTIVSLSLGSGCVMDFLHKATWAERELLLEPRSLLVMKGEARTVWTHGIAKRRSDRYHGRTIARHRRVLTFRKVILGGGSAKVCRRPFRLCLSRGSREPTRGWHADRKRHPRQAQQDARRP